MYSLIIKIKAFKVFSGTSYAPFKDVNHIFKLRVPSGIFFQFLLLTFLFPLIAHAQIKLISTGSGNVFVVQYPANITTLPTGISLTFFSNQTLTSPGASLNLNSTGAVTIFKNVNVPLAAQDILAGQPVTVIFDGTYWQLLSTSAIASTSNLWTVNGINMYPVNLSDRVGIGTSTPQNTLDVVGGGKD